MSYLFDGVDDYILTENAVATAVPLTIACWANVSNDTANHNLVSIVDKDADTDYFVLQANGTLGGDPIRAGTSSGAGTDFAASTTGYTTNTWFHACAVFALTTDRRAFINGGSKGTSTPSIAPLNLDRTSVGRLMRATPGGPVAGKVAEVAIWSAALSDSEVAQLASGTRPSMIQTNKLVYYQPLGSNANDLGPYRFSPIVISGAVPDTPHPTITDPSVGELYEEILADDPLRFYRLTEHGRYATDSGSQKIHFPATGEPLGKQAGAIISRPDEYSMTYDGVNDAHFGSAPNIATDAVGSATSKPWAMMMVAKLGATIVINTWMFGIGSSLSTTPLLGFSMANSNGRVQVQIRNQDNVTRALTPSPSTTDYRNAWRIYHMENDPTDTTNGMRFYVDGVLVDSGVPLDYGATPTIFDRMGIGGIYRTTIGTFAQTQLQYVAVYDHPLGQSRVTAHAQAFNKFPDYTPGSPIKPLKKSL